VVTNIDLEHLDFYKDLAMIRSVFLDFIDRVPFYGLAVLCLDNEPVQEIIPLVKKRFVTYGLSAQADVQARDVRFDGVQSRFGVYIKDRLSGEGVLNLPGMHNVYNSLAGIAVGMELEIPFEKIRWALETLEGVHRRMEVKGDAGGVKVVDDYGHHPTEIRTTLEAVRRSWPERRLIIVFQPHRYTRTQALFDEFTRSFYQSDMLLLLPVYPAGERPIEGVDSRALHEGIKRQGHKDALYFEDMAEAVECLAKTVKDRDLVLTLGAGDVWKVGEALLERLLKSPGPADASA